MLLGLVSKARLRSNLHQYKAAKNTSSKVSCLGYNDTSVKFRTASSVCFAYNVLVLIYHGPTKLAGGSIKDNIVIATTMGFIISKNRKIVFYGDIKHKNGDENKLECTFSGHLI